MRSPPRTIRDPQTLGRTRIRGLVLLSRFGHSARELGQASRSLPAVPAWRCPIVAMGLASRTTAKPSSPNSDGALPADPRRLPRRMVLAGRAVAALLLAATTRRRSTCPPTARIRATRGISRWPIIRDAVVERSGSRHDPRRPFHGRLSDHRGSHRGTRADRAPDLSLRLCSASRTFACRDAQGRAPPIAGRRNPRVAHDRMTMTFDPAKLEEKFYHDCPRGILDHASLAPLRTARRAAGNRPAGYSRGRRLAAQLHPLRR